MNCISVFSIEDGSGIHADPYLKDSTLVCKMSRNRILMDK